MKTKSLWLAMFALTPALYAQAEAPLFSREQVLEVFARFNPTVLDNAQKNTAYKSVLDLFVDNYQREISPAAEAELIAAVRNFDTSIRLDILTKAYRNQWLYAKMTGQPVMPVRQMFEEDLSEEMAHIWAVTVQTRKYQLNQAKEKRAQLRENSSAAHPGEEEALQAQVSALNAEIRTLTQAPGEYVTAAIENYVDNVDRELVKETFSVQRTQDEETAEQARATTNLQLKSKHKKPACKNQPYEYFYPCFHSHSLSNFIISFCTKKVLK